LKNITVLIADDHAFFRQGLRLLLAATGEIEVVGEAANGLLAVIETRRLQPDVVLMDIRMPSLDGLGAARQIMIEFPATKVIILSCYSDDRHVEEAVKAGVAGYLTKTTASNELLLAIRAATRGNPFISPLLGTRLLKYWRNRDLESEQTTTPLLTARQRAILQMIAEGCSNLEMGQAMSLSIKTVEKHRQTLMDKLDIHGVARLTRYAIEGGMIESGVRLIPA
jgi:DNA-binding NarL/FixJ family response regulator